MRFVYITQLMKLGYLLILLTLINFVKNESSLPSSEEIISKIQPKLNKLFPNPEKSPGVSLNVYFKGKIYATVNHGLENIITKKKITNQTVFGLASISKMFVGASIMLLIQENKIKLSDELSKYITEFKNYKFALNSRPIVLKDLVTMSTGFLDYTDNFENLSKLTNQEIIDKILLETPVFEVGSKHDYCNTDYNILATLVSRVSGQSFDDFVKEKFFKPLGMKSSFVVDRLDYKYDFVQGYVVNGEEIKEIREETPGAYGDGNVYTTSEDFEQWENMWSNHKILTEASINQIYQQGVIDNGIKVDYNFGWEIESTKVNDRIVSHEGSWEGTTTTYNRFVDREVSYSIFTNVNDYDYGELHSIMKEVLFGELNSKFLSFTVSILIIMLFF